MFLVLCSCNKKEVSIIEPEVIKQLPVINVDSIFINLDDEIIKKKAASIDKVFSNLRKKVGFNGTVLYAEKGRIVYKKAWGYRNLRKRSDDLQVDDIFQLSSVSKMFTAEAVMILKNEGLIDYDVDIREYIPEFPYFINCKILCFGAHFIFLTDIALYFCSKSSRPSQSSESLC